MNRDSMIYLFEWDDMCEDLTDEEFGKLIRAVSKYVQTGEKTKFSDRMVRSNFKTMTKTEDRFTQKYDEKCAKNRKNGMKGGRPKNDSVEKPNGFSENPKKANGFFKNPPEPEREPEPYPEPDRGRGGVEPAVPDTTTTTQLQEAIVEIWNSHDFVQKIKRVDSPQKRWERTEMAIAVAGGKKEFLHQLQTLDQHAYLKNQPDQGYKVIYDWLTAPENFQSFLEGRYKDARGDAKKYEGWEVVEFG